VEGALKGELDDHLGYGKHDPAGRDGGNSRNGYRAKTVLTEAGPVEISVPRDWNHASSGLSRLQAGLAGADRRRAVSSSPARALAVASARLTQMGRLTRWDLRWKL
jgi:hypothetical protein